LASKASKALGEHLVLREGHDLLREVTEPSCGGTGLVAHHVFGGDGIAQNLQASKAKKKNEAQKGWEKLEIGIYWDFKHQQYGFNGI
jgi:hypothetical protein